MNNNNFYIWNRTDDAKAYYHFKSVYVCPNCEVYCDNWNDFKEIHRHAEMFIKKKNKIYEVYKFHLDSQQELTDKGTLTRYFLILLIT